MGPHMRKIRRMSAEHPSVPSPGSLAVLAALESAPFDDEDVSFEEAEAAAQARADLRAGVPLVSHEAVRRSWLAKA